MSPNTWSAPVGRAACSVTPGQQCRGGGGLLRRCWRHPTDDRQPASIWASGRSRGRSASWVGTVSRTPVTCSFGPGWCSSRDFPTRCHSLGHGESRPLVSRTTDGVRPPSRPAGACTLRNHCRSQSECSALHSCVWAGMSASGALDHVAHRSSRSAITPKNAVSGRLDGVPSLIATGIRRASVLDAVLRRGTRCL